MKPGPKPSTNRGKAVQPPHPDAGGSSRNPWWWPLLPAAAAFLLYLAQIPAASGDKDGSEFTLVLAFAGAAHPTGYPIYTLVGHVFCSALHGLGASWPWAANTWSALGAAVAVFFLNALSLRLLPASAPMRKTSRFLAGLAPTLFFALNPIWTYEATLAEVYSWHVAWALLTAFVFSGMSRALASPSAQWAERQSRRVALVLGLLVGFGAAHHATSLFVSIPLALSLWMASRPLRRLGLRHAGLFAAAAAVPLCSYLFIAWRAFHPAAWNWPTLGASWGSIVDHIRGAAYGHFLGGFNPSPEQLSFLSAYVYPVLFPSMALLLAGTLRLTPGPAAWTARGLSLAAVLSLTYAFNYSVPDPSSYFLAPMAIAVAASVPGAAWLFRRPDIARRGRVAVAALLAAATLLVAPGWIRTGEERRQVMTHFDEQIHGMWDAVPFERAIILFPNDLNTRLREYQLLRGEKPGLEVCNPLQIIDPVVRTAFRRRHGFDPAAGVPAVEPSGEEGTRLRTEAVARTVNENSPLPVVVFDPANGSVRLMKKPSPPPGGVPPDRPEGRQAPE
ncbi:MAG: DUF2723 domain-containing protein [Acidobacteria bacterium]|nr:DUF2723 domain-containing protein [Acidobacteriota bacterium]